MIIESIVSTTNTDGSPHLSPMGPVFSDGYQRFELRPFAGSTTLANLVQKRSGVVHFVDDAMLFAQAVLHQWQETPPLRLADSASAPMLRDFLRAFEFQVTYVDETSNRVSLQCETVKEHLGGSPRGLCRGLNAVVEAAILISRINFLPKETIDSQWQELRRIVEKTGNNRDRKAMELLSAHLATTNRLVNDDRVDFQ